MTLTMQNRWAASGAIAASALIVYNPITFAFTDMLALGKNYIASDKGHCPTLVGYFIHVVVLFFVVYGILCISWSCE
jgi:hypothetical protein